MPYILDILKVKELAKWKAGFDSEDGNAMRKIAGMKSYQIFHIEEDPNNLLILCEFDNLDTARKFVQSDELRKASQQSGVIEVSDTYFLEEVEKGSV